MTTTTTNTETGAGVPAAQNFPQDSLDELNDIRDAALEYYTENGIPSEEYHK